MTLTGKLDTRTGLVSDIRLRGEDHEPLESHERIVEVERHPDAPARALRYDAQGRLALPVVGPHDARERAARELGPEVLGALALLQEDPQDAWAREVVRQAVARLKKA